MCIFSERLLWNMRDAQGERRHWNQIGRSLWLSTLEKAIDLACDMASVRNCK